jgi:hypothetical protein
MIDAVDKRSLSPPVERKQITYKIAPRGCLHLFCRVSPASSRAAAAFVLVREAGRPLFSSARPLGPSISLPLLLLLSLSRVFASSQLLTHTHPHPQRAGDSSSHRDLPTLRLLLSTTTLTCCLLSVVEPCDLLLTSITS